LVTLAEFAKTGNGWDRFPMPKGFTKEYLERLEEISFRNMVGFFREELNGISKGEIAKKVLTKGDRRCLRKLGILRLRGTGHGRILEVSLRAKILMGINETNYSSKDEDR
jgi:hypothetical protein